jgi:hypothetical protein
MLLSYCSDVASCHKVARCRLTAVDYCCVHELCQPQGMMDVMLHSS